MVTTPGCVAVVELVGDWAICDWLPWGCCIGGVSEHLTMVYHLNRCVLQQLNWLPWLPVIALVRLVGV